MFTPVQIFADWLIYNVFGIVKESRIGSALNFFVLFVAVVIGVPLYSNAAGVIPLVSELTMAGVAMGTSLAFMMAVTALSLPEAILLRRVLKPKLLAVFITIVGLGIVFTGYMFNYIIAWSILRMKGRFYIKL